MLPYGSAGKESACNAGDLGLILQLGRFPGEGKGYPLQCSGLENSMDCIVQGITKIQTRLSDFHFTSLLLAGGIPPSSRVLRGSVSLFFSLAKSETFHGFGTLIAHFSVITFCGTECCFNVKIAMFIFICLFSPGLCFLRQWNFFKNSYVVWLYNWF